MVKPIETKYRGYRFRSRLEARWAVCMDAAGVKWEYEAEGYDLGTQGWYLPDFFILGNAHYGPYVEIKPFKPTREETDKLVSLCSAQNAYGVFIWGAPGAEAGLDIHKDGFVMAELNGQEIIYHLMNYNNHFNYDRAVNTARNARFEHGDYP